ncbi:MLX-interacting protein [Geodia barretti]|uniref:MLX-interacting protein n=1 Tax=Geodia barretti TaxID=519541 RepID=A0AA35QXT1_GEOBA|nr:MLX-interacting protein [Geodia barretti]
MASASDGGRSPNTSPEASVGDAAGGTPERGRSAPSAPDDPRLPPPATATAKRSALHKPKPTEGGGYDFSGSYEQTRRVRFKFGVHSLAVEATLAKLFESLTMECSGVLVQPQWKHFRHFDMVKNDQIRLSNGIWRSWHIKYQKGSEPLFCTFDLNPNLNDHTRPEAVVLEGKYQKRKVEAVAREYRKWRMFHREKFRQGGCKRDPLLADLVENLRGDELGGGVELQAMQVDPPIPAGLIQLDELSDPLFMGLGQDYFPEYNASTNMMFQPKMDVLSSALDEFLGKLEPMEVLLSRTSSSNYQSPLVAFPQMTNPAPFPQATPPLQQQLFSPQMAHPSLPPSHPPMGSSLLSDFGVTDPPSSMFPSFSPPPQSYFDPQQSSNYDNRHSLTPAQTPPPDHQFSLPPEVPGGLETSSMFHFPLKRDPSSDSLKSPHGEFVAPSNGGQSPTNIPLTNPEYGGSRSQPSEYNFVSPGQPPMGRSDITVDTSQQRLSYRQISSGDMFPGVLDAGQRSTIDNVAMSYNTPQGGVVSMEGGGILGSKRKEGSHQFLPGSKRRSPHNSQSDLPLWGNEEGGAPGVPGSSMLPPSGPTFLSSRRASIGSAAQLSDRPVLQKNASEPAGSLLLREQLKLLTQQHEAHSQELDKQQSLAQQQYRDVLHQYKKQVVGQEQLSESDKHLLRTVLAKPALLDVLRALLSPSSSPSFSQPTPSPLLLTPSPTPSSSSHLPPVTSFLPAAGGGGSAERENPLPNEELASPENVKQVTEFQSRLLVAAAVQASGGSNTRASNSASLASTPEPAPFPGDTELLSPESRSGTGAETTPSISFKIKSSRGLSSEQKEVWTIRFITLFRFWLLHCSLPSHSSLPPFLPFSSPPSLSRCSRRSRDNLTSLLSRGDEGPSSRDSTSCRLSWWTPLPIPVEKSARPLF